MDTCTRCGAAFHIEASWCWRCYAAVGDGGPDARSQDAVVLVTREDGDSLLASGPMRLSAPVRALLSVLVVAGGVWFVVAFLPWGDAAPPLWALAFILATIYSFVGGLFIARLWAGEESGRSQEHLILLDRSKIAEVERRQQSLIADPVRAAHA